MLTAATSPLAHARRPLVPSQTPCDEPGSPVATAHAYCACASGDETNEPQRPPNSPARLLSVPRPATAIADSGPRLGALSRPPIHHLAAFDCCYSSPSLAVPLFSFPLLRPNRRWKHQSSALALVHVHLMFRLLAPAAVPLSLSQDIAFSPSLPRAGARGPIVTISPSRMELLVFE